VPESRVDQLLDRLQARSAAKIHTVADARRLARRRVPVAVRDYIEGGAGSELTMAANLAAIESLQFLPRTGQTTGAAPSLAATVSGTPVSMPILVGPVGFTRMMDPLGDVAGARAAAAAGTIFTLSSMSGHTIDEVAAATDATHPKWFQLYFLGGRQGAEQLVDQAKRAGYSALVVTMDTQIPGNRERDLRYGLSPPLQLNRRTMTKLAPQVAIRPRWLLDAARDGFQLDLVNSQGLGDPGTPMSSIESLIHWIGRPATWDDFSWIREQWDGPILAKGLVTGDDARRAVDAGASGVIVSNHGGRQLDPVPASLPALVEVIAAVGAETEVLVDGGIRRGADVALALALGARAVLIGRAWAYGLAAAGQPGVERVLSILRADLDRTLRLLGCASVAELDRSLVRVPRDW
jgi:isopentenyl diphosphate isomerase/L-lactate dehydrogenase-like FMN-dependent dehydrogenase